MFPSLQQNEIDNDVSGLTDLPIQSYDEYLWLLKRPANCYPDATIMGWILATLFDTTVQFQRVNAIEQEHRSKFALDKSQKLSPLPENHHESGTF